ncbi:hypothetical protein GCM10010344_06080 [Streptomyces bluensis]|nr:hypothetical protein GCM10010344_06080 [Streptomyces bluensis]
MIWVYTESPLVTVTRKVAETSPDADAEAGAESASEPAAARPAGQG